MRHNASQCQTQRQIFPLIEDGNLSEQPEPPLSSLLFRWRKQRREAEREALTPQRRGPKPDLALAQKRREAGQTREIVRLRAELARAHIVIDVQKKLCTLLG